MMWQNCSRHIHAHDEENFCKSGDKVVIRRCRTMSSIKNYYVRNIILPTARQNLTGEPQTDYEANALKFNEDLRNKPLKHWF